jgi:hypothetical protein
MWQEWRSPADFWDAAFAAAEELDRPYMAFAVRSSTPIRADLSERFDAILEHLLTDPRARRLVFTTPQEMFNGVGTRQRALDAAAPNHPSRWGRISDSRGAD